MSRPLTSGRVTELAFAIVAIAFLVPLDPVIAASGVDPSWQQALHAAIERGLQFGSDLVFTYGPLGFAHTRLYWPGLFGATLAYWLGLAAALAWTAVTLARSPAGTPWIFWPALFTVVPLCALYSPDAVPFALALLVVWSVHLACPSLVAFSALCAVLGVVSLAKLTNAMAGGVALAGAVAILLLRGRPRQAAAGALAFAGALLLGWLAAGQRLGGIADFARNTLEMVTGYGAAMAMASPPAEKAVFAALAALALARPVWRAFASRDAAAIAACVSTALLLVLAYRQGFTRFDRFHVVTAFAVLTIAAMAAALPAGLAAARLDRWAASAIAIAAFAALVFSIQVHFYNAPPLVAIRVVEGAVASVKGAWDIATGAARLRARHEAALGEIRAAIPLPALEGTIDSYSHDQAALLAHGLRWSPRPAFQSYYTYTPRLMALNADYITGPGAPDHLLFALQPIDGRLPALEDGASWLPILERYALRAKGERLLLDRASSARTSTRYFLGTRHGSGWINFLPGAIDIPGVGGLRLAAFRVGTPEGTSLFEKRVGYTIELRLGGARRASYRFVPGAAELPFLFSPLVATTADFARLFDECHDAANQVSGVRILDAAGREVPYEIDLYAVTLTPRPTGAAPGCSSR